MKYRLTFISNQIQLTVSEDGIVTVVEPGGGKLVDKEELHEAIKMPGTDHTLTVHQLQQIVGQQVSTLSVVRRPYNSYPPTCLQIFTYYQKTTGNTHIT